jgi:hypothetical protein
VALAWFVLDYEAGLERGGNRPREPEARRGLPIEADAEKSGESAAGIAAPETMVLFFPFVNFPLADGGRDESGGLGPAGDGGAPLADGMTNDELRRTRLEDAGGSSSPPTDPGSWEGEPTGLADVEKLLLRPKP